MATATTLGAIMVVGDTAAGGAVHTGDAQEQSKQLRPFIIDFDLIDAGLKALLNSRPDPAVAQKAEDLRSMFRDAYTGWLEIEEEAA